MKIREFLYWRLWDIADWWDSNAMIVATWVIFFAMLAGTIYISYIALDRNKKWTGVCWLIILSIILSFVRYVMVQGGNAEWDTTVWEFIRQQIN